MLGRFGLGAPTVRAWTVTIREEGGGEDVHIHMPSPKRAPDQIRYGAVTLYSIIENL
jgi:hypothetical protein